MTALDPKTYLWKNVCELVGIESPGIDEVQRHLKIGRGTVQRIKEGQTSVGLDVLATIAAKFNIEVWQLLVPEIRSGKVPALTESSLPLSSELIRRLQQEDGEALYRVENSVRSQLGMDPLPRTSKQAA